MVLDHSVEDHVFRSQLVSLVPVYNASGPARFADVEETNDSPCSWRA